MTTASDLNKLFKAMSADQRAGTGVVTSEVFDERLRQHTKWGQQDHPYFINGESNFGSVPRTELYAIPSADDARDNCEMAFSEGHPNWGSILIEEVCEAFEEGLTEDHLREELVQVAAVAVAWIEAIDRRKHAAVYADAAKTIFGENSDAGTTAE